MEDSKKFLTKDVQDFILWRAKCDFSRSDSVEKSLASIIEQIEQVERDAFLAGWKSGCDAAAKLITESRST